MRYDPWLTEISPADIEAAHQRKAAREALIAEQAAEITRLRAKLDTARREGMEEAVSEAQARAKFWVSGNNEEAKIRYDEARKIAAAIRAALTGGKDE